MLLIFRDEQAWDRLSVTERPPIDGTTVKLSEELIEKGAIEGLNRTLDRLKAHLGESRC